MTPEQLLYAKTHEWVHVETDPSGAKIATVGLSAFALEVLTDLVYIELPDVGRQVEAGAPICSAPSTAKSSRSIPTWPMASAGWATIPMSPAGW